MSNVANISKRRDWQLGTVQRAYSAMNPELFEG